MSLSSVLAPLEKDGPTGSADLSASEGLHTQLPGLPPAPQPASHVTLSAHAVSSACTCAPLKAQCESLQQGLLPRSLGLGQAIVFRMLQEVQLPGTVCLIGSAASCSQLRCPGVRSVFTPAALLWYLVHHWSVFILLESPVPRVQPYLPGHSSELPL